jgi:hypothetical protein
VLRRRTSLTAEPREVDGGGWYVFWFDADTRAYGARGWGLTEDAARALAARINDGEETP